MSYKCNDTDLNENDEEEIRKLLLFHSVKVVGNDQLVLDDGTVLTVQPNDGGCSCGQGDYEISALNGCENVITSVSVESHDSHDVEGDCETVYSIFVYAENKQINLLSVSGSDGYGYYGTGYRISVSRPKITEPSRRHIQWPPTKDGK